MVTSADIQQRIVLEVGDTREQVLSAMVASVWAEFADKAYIHPRLQELYTKRALIDIKLGSKRDAG